MHSPDQLAVNLDELRQIVELLSTLQAELDEHPVNELDADGSAFGNKDLARAVTDYCNRWQVGIKQLSDDSQEFQNRLQATINGYLDMDKEAASRFIAIVEGDQNA